MKQAFTQKWKLYLMEALGLGIFMISTCLFGALMESEESVVHQFISDPFQRRVLTAMIMCGTGMFIFYSPFTSGSGSHINPAVTLTFWRLGKINRWDAFFYIIFQFIGATLAVYLMAALMGSMLTAPPVNTAVTVPLESTEKVFITEFFIAFIMMSMVLFTSASDKLSKYTRVLAACMVGIYVILIAPISGFGMNPARSFASALPAGIWTAWWIYMIVPVAGMLAAAECFLQFNKVKTKLISI